MKEKSSNKMIAKEDSKTKKGEGLKAFSFKGNPPVTILAKNQDDANKKFNKLIKDKKHE